MKILDENGLLYLWQKIKAVISKTTGIPTNGIIDYEGDTIPEGFEEVEDDGGIVTVTNANGTAIKYPDGTMICMKESVVGTYLITTPWGTMYEAASDSTVGAISFPVPFVEIYSLTATQVYTGSGGILGDIAYNNTGITRVNFRRPTMAESYLAYSYQVIGRWK